MLLCEDLLRPLPGSGVTLGEAVSFLCHDRQAAAEARTRRKAPARPGGGVQPSLPDLFGEEPPWSERLSPR